MCAVASMFFSTSVAQIGNLGSEPSHPTIIVREQRVEWHAKATEEHPDVLSLNSERKRFFQEFLLTGSITAKSIAQAQCEDEVCLFDDSTTSTTSKKPRLFKDGIL